MRDRFFTSAESFSTTKSAFFTMRRRNAASPCFDFRFRVMLRLFDCRFWKSGPSRGPPGGSPVTSSGAARPLMTLAPQSRAGRTQVGPDRTWVRSRHGKAFRAQREAPWSRHFLHCRGDFRDVYTYPGGMRRAARHSPILRCCLPRNGTRQRVFLRRQAPSLPSTQWPKSIRRATCKRANPHCDRAMESNPCSLLPPRRSLSPRSPPRRLPSCPRVHKHLHRRWAEIAGYQRAPTAWERLIAGAKKEGVVSGLRLSSVSEDMSRSPTPSRPSTARTFSTARELGEPGAAHRGGDARGPLPGRRFANGRGRARGAASRKAAAGGQDPAHRRPDAASLAAAWRMGGKPPQHLLGCSTPTW